MKAIALELDSIGGEMTFPGQDSLRIQHWFYQMDLQGPSPLRGGLFLFCNLNHQEEFLLKTCDAMGLSGFHIWHPIARQLSTYSPTLVMPHLEPVTKAPLSVLADSPADLQQLLKTMELKTVDITTTMLQALQTTSQRYRLAAKPPEDS